MTDATRRAPRTRARRPPRTRRSLLAAASVTLLAGCLGGGRAARSPDPDHAVSLRNDAEVTLTVRIRVVRVKTDETVFEATREIAPGQTVGAYNTERADPEGVERFEICAEIVGAAGTTTAPETTDAPEFEGGTTVPWDEFGEGSSRGCYAIRTDDCTGDVAAIAQDHDSLRFAQGVC